MAVKQLHLVGNYTSSLRVLHLLSLLLNVSSTQSYIYGIVTAGTSYTA